MNTRGGRMKQIKIGDKIITKGKLEKPYLIMEAGVNHEGDIEKAKLMISQAAVAGADAIKFQTYKAEKLASKKSPSYWDRTEEKTASQYELFKKYDSFGIEEYTLLSNYAKTEGIGFLSTPFDFESADILEDLVPAYKIASADITNIPFLKYIARKGKPVILSTGASYVSEIWQAIEAMQSEGNDQIILLHCVLNYPTKYENANLGMIKNMVTVFQDYILGYSDHTLPDHSKDLLTLSWLLGAQVIEKHFTYDKTLPGNDHYHALDHRDLNELISHFCFIESMLGSLKKEPLPEEDVARKNARRSIYAECDIPKGKIIDENDISIKRPAFGIQPSLWEELIGSIALKAIQKDNAIVYGDFSNDYSSLPSGRQKRNT
jgi:N-acetylneuraminate synthase